MRGNQFVADAQHKAMLVAGLSPSAKKAGVFLVPVGNENVKFLQFLFSAIVRSERKRKRLGLLVGAATSRVRAKLNADMAGID